MATALRLDEDEARPAAFEAPVPIGVVLRHCLAFTSLAAAAVHASAIAGHTFHWLHASAFVAMTVFQAWWAYLILRSPARPVLVLGAAGHGLIVLLWLVSRTAGIPAFLPGGHAAEPVAVKDGIATLLAVVTLAGIDLLSRRDLARRGIRASAAGAVAGATLVGVVVLASVAALSGGHVHADFDHQHGDAPAREGASP